MLDASSSRSTHDRAQTRLALHGLPHRREQLPGRAGARQPLDPSAGGGEFGERLGGTAGLLLDGEGGGPSEMSLFYAEFWVAFLLTRLDSSSIFMP